MKRSTLIEEKIIAVLLCVMVVMVAAQVLSRYILHRSLSHTEELVRYMFVWATFLGASAAVFRGGHLSISGVLRTLPERLKKLIRLLTGFAAVLFSGLLIIYGTNVVLLQIRTGQKTAALGLPMWIIGLAVPVCSGILLIRIFMKFFGNGRSG